MNAKKTMQQEIATLLEQEEIQKLETVDFSNITRAKTCLEVDFPILPINQIATLEGSVRKPIYQISKWWARRRSSIFRSILLSAVIKAPNDRNKAAQTVWKSYYANHQKALKHIKVADIFMGGGTTVVEASRLGMQVVGNDLNPVAWFLVKNEMAQVNKQEVISLVKQIETKLQPQLMPFYSCHCPRGHQSQWIHISTGKSMSKNFSPVSLSPQEREQYLYQGPETIYTFWAKHGCCQRKSCQHRTPLIAKPNIVTQTLSVRVWKNIRCVFCQKTFDVEPKHTQIAPGTPFVVSTKEKPFAVLDTKSNQVQCPECQHKQTFVPTKQESKKALFSLLLHPMWLSGSPGLSPDGTPYGGSAIDTSESTNAWNEERSRQLSFLEIRGKLPAKVLCPKTKQWIKTGKKAGNLPKRSYFTCGACGLTQSILKSTKQLGKTAPISPYAIQGYCPTCHQEKQPYGGKFFSPIFSIISLDFAQREWERQKQTTLKKYWPKSKVPFGFMTSLSNGGIPNHGYTHWWKMFHPRQLLVHTTLLREIIDGVGKNYCTTTQEFVLGAFQQYLRNQNMFCFWNSVANKLEPMFSNSNYHPKATVIENNVFSPVGRGNWRACSQSLVKAIEWLESPWELVSTERLNSYRSRVFTGKSQKFFCGDAPTRNVQLLCTSSSDLGMLAKQSFDLVVTDPPFGNLLHYSELSDFFYVWLQIALQKRYETHFSTLYTPKALEAVSNRARHPKNPDQIYQNILTKCWKEAYRILKPGGILVFTFHHSAQSPWISILESLCSAGFYLEITYPVRSDESKGKGEFGSKKIEYDIIHVCRKREKEPQAIDWVVLQKKIQTEMKTLQTRLNAQLSKADKQVLLRGKILEYYSRHYKNVYTDFNKIISLQEILFQEKEMLKTSFHS